MKEIRMDIQSELAMNIVNYLIAEENYIYVGNEREIWLENLSHPTVQLIYLNQHSLYNEEQSSQIFKKIKHVRAHIRKHYLLWRVNVAILNLDKTSIGVLNGEDSYLKIIHIKDVLDISANEELHKMFPGLSQKSLERPLGELIVEIQSTSKKKALEVQNALKFPKKPYVVVTFLALITVMFIYLNVTTDPMWQTIVAIAYGAKYNPLIAAGQYWRLVTPSLIHFELFHLLFNAVFIYRFGKMLEQVFGWWRMVVLILVSAIVGNLFSFAFLPNVSLGASTVAYGFLGGLLFLGFENRKTFMVLVKNMVLPIVLFSFVFSFMDTQTDAFGHLGGFIGGFLIVSILGVPTYSRFWTRTLLASATMLLLVSGLFARGVALERETDFGNYNIALIQYFVEQGQEERAFRLMETLNLNLESILIR